MNSFLFKAFLILHLFLAGSFMLSGQTAKIQPSPASVGKKIADNSIGRRSGWRYPKVCTYYGSLLFAAAVQDSAILTRLEEKLKRRHKIRSGHVDYNVFGIWPFEIYRQTRDKKYLEMGRKLADDEYKSVRNDGLATYTRFWVDDMYMVGSLQVQAFKSTGDQIYLDRAALQLKTYCDQLQRPDGLFFHREDAPFYWGRGNGWAAAALTELLLVLPKTHQHYPSILSAYQKMMHELLNCQGKDGMWHQLLDDPESYPETSCTGMFIYALASGLGHGWISAPGYSDKVRRGWSALAGHVNQRGEVMNVCVGTNAKNNKRHYLTRPQSTGNFHGQAAVLWAATAMIGLEQLSDIYSIKTKK